MKKTYSKPEILFESFVANVNIAACENDVNRPTASTCVIAYEPNFKLFVSGPCTTPITPENELEYGVCYHNPTDLTRMFGS